MSDVLVLCYHAVSDGWPAMMALPGETLERQLTHLVERGYRGATFSEAVLDPPARRTLAVTFDDGFGSVIEHAFPILSQLGLPGSVFVPSAPIDGSGPISWDGPDRWLDTPHEGELRSMSWAELGSLADAGWEIGSHSRTHPRLTELEDGRLAEELRGSRADCEDGLGRPCRSIAYPYGDVDRRVVRAARDAGYETAAALPLRLHRRRPLEWPRVGIYRNDPFRRFEAKVGRVRRNLIGSRVGEALVPGGVRIEAGA